MLRHLDAFVGGTWRRGSASDWPQRTDEQRVLEAHAGRPSAASWPRWSQARAAHGRARGGRHHPVGLELIERIDAEREATGRLVADIEARLGEFRRARPPTRSSTTTAIRDAVTGRIAKASGPSDVAPVLADVFEGIWAELT